MNTQKHFLPLFLLYCSFIIVSNPLTGQNSLFSTPAVTVDSLQEFENYTVEDGLPSNRIYDILEDKYGYIWIATGLGLSRFNGASFKNYYHNPLEITSISNNKVTRLAEDSEGNLWVGTTNGLNKFVRKDESFQRFYQDKYRSNSLPGNHIRAMLADTSGIIWLETANGFFSCFDTKKQTFENYGHEPVETRYPTHTIKKRKNGNILILGRRIIPKEFNVSTKKLEELEDLKRYYFASSFYESNSGEILFSNSAAHSFVTDANIKNPQNFPTLSSIYDVIEDKDGVLWLGGYKSGAIQYNLNKNTITRYKNERKRKESIISDYIFKIYEDKSGQLWFATIAGLSKLKSNQFIKHIKNEKGSNKITAIVPSEDTKQLWISTSDDGLFTYDLDTRKYEQHITTPQLLSNVIQDIHLDTAGQLWIAQWQGKGFNILDTKTGNVKEKKLCDNPYYDWWSSILETRDKKIYLSSWGMGPIQVNRKDNVLTQEHWRPSYSKGFIARPIVTSNDEVYFTDGGRIIKRNLHSKIDLVNKRNYSKDHACIYRYNPHIKYASTNKKWITRRRIWHSKSIANRIWTTISENGLFLMDTSTLKIEYSSLNSLQDTIIDIAISKNTYLLGPSSINIVSTEEDLMDELILPFGVEVSGKSSIQVFNENIFVTSPKYLQVYNQQIQKWIYLDYTKKEEKIVATLEKENQIWLATSSAIYQVNEKDLSLSKVSINEDRFKMNNISCFAIENNDRFWLGTDTGLYFIDLLENSTTPYFNSAKDTLSLPSDKILSLRLESNNDLWIGTQKGIAKFNNGTNNFTRYNQNSKDGLSSSLTISMLEDSSNNIWVGNSGGSLDRVDIKTNTFTHFFKEPWNPKSLKPDEENQINCIYEDTNGRIWIGGGSLSLFNEELQNFTHFNDQSDNPFNSVKSIVEDDLGNLWLGTNRGLFLFDTNTESFQYFGLDNNIQGLSFSGASCKLPDGRLVIGGDNGFNIIEANYRVKKKGKPTIQLYNFKTSDDFFKEELNDNEEISLKHTQNSIQLNVSLGCYKEGNKYRYKLSGYNNKWMTKPSKDDLIQFENLSPGVYTLEVQYGNSFEAWSEDSAIVNIEIAKPFWNTWWFFACTFIPFSILISFLTKRQQEKVIARKDKDFQLQFMKIKASLANMNPHFIFNVLGSIQNQVLEGEKQAASNSIVKLSKLIRRFLDSTANMTLPSLTNYSSRIDELPLNEEIELISMYIEFEQSQHHDKFHYQLDIEPGLEPNNYSIPPMLIQPFVENAIKHGLLPKKSKGTLNISFNKLEEEGIEILISDDGIGLKKSKEIKRHTNKSHESKGLHLLHDRIELLNQLGYNISVETISKDAGGTLVTLKINRNYD